MTGRSTSFVSTMKMLVLGLTKERGAEGKNKRMMLQYGNLWVLGW